MSQPTAVIINDTYPAVAHFQDEETLVVIETPDVSLVIADTGLPGPAGASLGLKGEFAYGDATPFLLGTLPTGLYNPNTRIDVIVPFDGSGVTLSIGSMADPDLVLAQTDCNPTESGTYQVASALIVGTDTEIFLFIQPGSGATQGTGRFWLDLV